MKKLSKHLIWKKKTTTTTTTKNHFTIAEIFYAKPGLKIHGGKGQLAPNFQKITHVSEILVFGKMNYEGYPLLIKPLIQNIFWPLC